MELFEIALKELVGIEGDYSNHPSDSGGKTRFGITEAVARKHGYSDEMQNLPFSIAKEIYRKAYWDSQNLDAIAKLSSKIALEVFDTGVNLGINRSGEFLQASLNALNRRQKDYPDIDVDAVVGFKTVAALKAFLELRGKSGEVVLCRALNSLQGAFYLALAESREKDEDFVFGWFLHRVA